MKKILLSLIFILAIKSVHAECSETGMWFYPNKKEINLNSIFMIEGYSLSQKTINSFKTRDVFLEDKNGDLVKLELLEILKGEMRLTQALFKPLTNLKPCQTYYLKYSNQTKIETEEIKRYNLETNLYEEVYWVTKENDLNSSINPNLSIEFSETEVMYFGCGPSANANFYIDSNTENEFLYKTELIEISTNKKAIYYLKDWEGIISVGHDMCSGPFKFKKESKYKVRFSPVNFRGKQLKSTKWIIFNSPFINQKNG